VRLIRKFARDRRGATMIEYGLILAFVFVVMMVAVHALADEVVGTLTSVKNQVVNAGAT
jgi:pilus assembly protein Flp/PilA